MTIFVGLVAKVDTDIGFVGYFVFAETCVLVLAHQRATDFIGDGLKVWREQF